MKILTALRLSNREPVWLACDHSWTSSIAAAEIAADAVTEEKLERAGIAARLKQEVCDLRFIDVAIVDGLASPLGGRKSEVAGKQAASHGNMAA